MCGWNGVVGSGTDYISSIFRYHHYVLAGSLESREEPSSDYQRDNTCSNVTTTTADANSCTLVSQYWDQTFVPIDTENTDLIPWFEWFVDTVGIKVAHELLLDSLQDLDNMMRTILYQNVSI